MKKVTTFLVLGLIFVVIAGVIGCAQTPAPSQAPATSKAPATSQAPAATSAKPPTATAEQPFTIDFRSQQFGSLAYIIGTALEELTKNHPWLHVSNLEAPGAAWSAEYMGSTPAVWPNTVTTFSPLTVSDAMQGVGSYAGKPPLPALKDFKSLFCTSTMLIHFMTFDPKIKTVSDLEGKTVGLGTKGGGAWGQVPTLMFDALGIKPKLQYLGNNQSQQALVQGKVDAAICVTYTNYETTKSIPNEVYTQTIATPGKETYTVSWGEQNCKTLLAKLGTLVTATKVSANTFKNQPEAVWMMSSPSGFGVHATFPDRVITELLKLWGTNYAKYSDRHEQMQVLSLETMAKGYAKESYHPTAIKAFEAMGVKY